MDFENFSFPTENQAVAYVAPQVEIIEVNVEKGFAQSTEGLQKRGYNWDEL